MQIEDRLVSSTGARSVVRRSTIGDGIASCHAANNPKVTSEAASSDSVSRSVQPQTAPLEIGSSSSTSPAASSTVPSGSKRPVDTGGTAGTRVTNSTNAVTPSPVVSQNSACQW